MQRDLKKQVIILESPRNLALVAPLLLTNGLLWHLQLLKTNATPKPPDEGASISHVRRYGVDLQDKPSNIIKPEHPSLPTSTLIVEQLGACA